MIFQIVSMSFVCIPSTPLSGSMQDLEHMKLIARTQVRALLGGLLRVVVVLVGVVSVAVA